MLYVARRRLVRRAKERTDFRSRCPLYGRGIAWAQPAAAASRSETDVEGLEAAGRRTNLLVGSPHVAAHFGRISFSSRSISAGEPSTTSWTRPSDRFFDKPRNGQPRGERPDCVAETHPLDVAGVVDLALFAFGGQGRVRSPASVGLCGRMPQTVANGTNPRISRRLATFQTAQRGKYTEILPGFPAAVRS